MFGAENCGISQVNIPAVLIANGLGACLMISILFSKHRRARSVTYDGKLFFLMCYFCFALCLLETAGFLLDGKLFAGARQLVIGVNVTLYFLSTALAFSWACFVDYKLFGDHKRLRHRYPLLAIPGGIICLMAAANLFYPVFFEVNQANVYVRTSWFVLPYLVMYFYLTYGAILACRYRKRVDKYLFMPVMVFLIPLYIGSIVQLLCYGLALIWPTTALGLIFLYINLQNEETFLDPLTNLYNRNFLLYYMERIAKRGKRGPHTTGIMLDINRFKHINDTYGHGQGDAVLQAVGNILLQAAADDAVVIRYGGDEFVILLENATAERVQCINDGIQEALRVYNASGSAPLPVTLSAGTAEFDHTDIFSFFQEMDRRMYDEKRTFYIRNGINHL
nr:GGDEF domain-containing protein [uncultured Oscillibacter sp.]